MATAKAGKADNQTPTAPAQAGPTAEDLQTDAALAGGAPAFAGGASMAGKGGTVEETTLAREEFHSIERVAIKMKTVSAGPDPAKNWNLGAIRFVDMDEAEALVSGNLAEFV